MIAVANQLVVFFYVGLIIFSALEFGPIQHDRDHFDADLVQRADCPKQFFFFNGFRTYDQHGDVTEAKWQCAGK